MASTIDELAATVEARGITLHWVDLGARHGQYTPPSTITINPCRPATVQLCTLAHELGHYELGHTPTTDPVVHARQERAADLYAARMLISRVEYQLAEQLHGPHPAALARELGVVSWVIRAYQQHLGETIGAVA